MRSGRLGSSKDMDRSPFECSRQLLEPSSGQLSLGDRLELVFADSDLVPLLLQENYVNHKPAITSACGGVFEGGGSLARAIRQPNGVNGTEKRHPCSVYGHGRARAQRDAHVAGPEGRVNAAGWAFASRWR